MDHLRPKTSKINPIIRYIIVADLTFWTAIYLFFPLISIFIVNEINGSVKDAAISTALYFFFRGILDIFDSRLFKLNTDKKKLHFIFIGGFIVILSFILFYFSHTILQIYIIFSVFGVGVGTLRPNQYALFSKYLDLDKETEEWGYFDAIGLFGVVVASLLAGFIAEAFGFRLIFVFSSVLGVFSLLPYLFVYKEIYATSK